MNWTGQAAHVARKDVRHARVALGVYALIVLVALVDALTQPAGATRSVWIGMAPGVMMLFGIILVASAVQADSPTESNAFWASRPFHPTAVLGGKMLFAVTMIVGMALVAELIGLAQFQVGAAAIAAALARSFVFYTVLLIAAIVVAALTRDVRGFIVASLALLVGIAAAVALFSSAPRVSDANAAAPRWIGTLLSVLADVVAIGGGAALLAWLYRRRDVNRVAWVGATIVVVACLAMLATVDESHAASDTPPSNRPPIAVEAFDFSDARAGAGPLLRIRFTAPEVGPVRRVTLRVAKVVVHLRDGSAVVGRPSSTPLDLSDRSAGLPAGIRLFGDSSLEQPTRGVAVTFREADQRRLSNAAIASVDVEGRATISDALPLMSTNVGTPGSATVAGTRVRVGHSPYVSDGDAIEVSTASTAAGNDLGSPMISVVIVNDVRREGIILHAGEFATGASWVVLPGAPVRTSRLRFDPGRPQSSAGFSMVVSAPFVGPYAEEAPRSTPIRQGNFPALAWYSGARLTVIRWTNPSSYAVRASKAAP
jgi:hypothetical protein